MSDTLQPGPSNTTVRKGIAIESTAVVKPTLSRVPLIGRINRAIGSTSERWARALVIKHLSSMKRGHLLLVEGDKEWHLGAPHNAENDDDSHICATIIVQDPAAFSYIALNGVVGAAEAYMDGHWTTPDLVQVVRFMVFNMTALKGMDKERSITNKVALTALDLIRRNSVARARENISAHYDLGNDFFELFLDPTMMYLSLIHI